MPFNIVRNDITKLHVDVIVNAANTALQMGGGVCGAIFTAAGADKLQAACNKLAPIKTGEAVITKGFLLPAKYIIHTAGVIYRGGGNGEEELLRSCYINSLELAVRHGCESIAFPLISSGIYGYPKADALRIAVEAITGFINDHDIDVLLVVFDKAAFAFSEELLGAVESYIDEHYVEESSIKRPRALGIKYKAEDFKHSAEEAEHMPAMLGIEPGADDFEDSAETPHTPVIFEKMSAPSMMRSKRAELADLVDNLDEPFSVILLRLIDKADKKDSEIYRRANIDRRLFSKIRSSKGYMPSKPTVLAFAVALELTLKQTEDLLARAGFALSHSHKFDVIVEYFISNANYDIFQINEVLFCYDQPLLGGSR